MSKRPQRVRISYLEAAIFQDSGAGLLTGSSRIPALKSAFSAFPRILQSPDILLYVSNYPNSAPVICNQKLLTDLAECNKRGFHKSRVVRKAKIAANEQLYFYFYLFNFVL